MARLMSRFCEDLSPIMANRVAPSRHHADNPAGSFMPAACNDWHDVRRFHVGTGHSAPTPDAGYTTACATQKPNLSLSLGFWGESIYEGLASPGSYAELGTPSTGAVSRSDTNNSSWPTAVDTSSKLG